MWFLCMVFLLLDLSMHWRRLVKNIILRAEPKYWGKRVAIYWWNHRRFSIIVGSTCPGCPKVYACVSNCPCLCPSVCLCLWVWSAYIVDWPTVCVLSERREEFSSGWPGQQQRKMADGKISWFLLMVKSKSISVFLETKVKPASVVVRSKAKSTFVVVQSKAVVIWPARFHGDLLS